jgi:hypothetical protein
MKQIAFKSMTIMGVLRDHPIAWRVYKTQPAMDKQGETT